MNQVTASSSPFSERPWLLGLVVAAGSIGVFLIWGLLGWPGAADSCIASGNCYCEASVTGTAEVFGKQPANTWSNLFPIAAGLIILVWAGRDRGRAAGALNPMTGGGLYPLLFGFVVLLLGPGSMAFHGSLTHVGGWLDNLSMIAFISFIVLYDLARLLRFDSSPVAFLVSYGLTLAVLGVLTFLIDGSGTVVFGIVVGLAVLMELWIVWRSPMGVNRTAIPWLLVALVTFAVAFVIWRLSWTGAPLCDPTSLLQGHAIWHALAECVVPLSIFAYLRTEQRANAAAR
jgi:dihydroceramidase